jgi:hypothetical protein
MMSDPQSKTELAEQLSKIQRAVTGTVQGMSAAQFASGTAESWSAADYLRHLILSVKPFAKAMNLGAATLQKMFGLPERASLTYAELVAGYEAKLAEGFRAEDNERVIPVSYRFPEGTTDEKEHLVQAWNDGNNRLLEALKVWSEEDLDTHQLPHPAIGMLTVREMLFFTLHHNTMHWHDIEQAASAYSGV